MMDPQSAVPGVRTVDHTADLAVEIEAASLPELFDRAARGTVALIETDDASTASCAPRMERVVEPHRIALDAATLPDLLVRWLREIMYLHQVRGLAYRRGRVHVADGPTLLAEAEMEPETGSALRELKGVTYHGLEVARSADGWRARVIYDV